MAPHSRRATCGFQFRCSAGLARTRILASMADDKDSKLQQISTTIAALVASTPLLGGDKWGAALGLSGVGLASVIENIRARTNKLDEMVRDVLADERLMNRFD